MKVTKQTTYNWEAGMNVSEQKARDFANYLLGMIDNKPVKQPMPFEIAPKATTSKGTWYHAKRYVEELTIDGKTDWRLPTLREIFTQKLYGWYSGNDNVRNSHGIVMPVRDLKDD